jgi:hypothetical protein
MSIGARHHNSIDVAILHHRSEVSPAMIHCGGEKASRLICRGYRADGTVRHRLPRSGSLFLDARGWLPTSNYFCLVSHVATGLIIFESMSGFRVSFSITHIVTLILTTLFTFLIMLRHKEFSRYSERTALSVVQRWSVQYCWRWRDFVNTWHKIHWRRSLD